MKKTYFILTIISFLICLTACKNQNSKAIALPEADEIKKIELEFINKEGLEKTVNIKEGINELINEIIKESKYTNKQSVSDNPVNIDEYIAVKFYHDKEPKGISIAYIYADKDGKYIEQPYAGIWKIKDEIYDDIINKKISAPSS